MNPTVDGNGPQECGSAHEDGGLVLGANTCQSLNVGGVRAEHHGNAIQQGHHEGHGKPEGMEQWEQRRHHIGTAELYHIIALLGVGNHVLVGQFYPLRGTFRTGTEKDDGIVF